MGINERIEIDDPGNEKCIICEHWIKCAVNVMSEYARCANCGNVWHKTRKRWELFGRNGSRDIFVLAAR